MKAFTQPISNLGEFEQITRSLSKTKGMVEVTGCIDSSKSHFIYCAGEAYSCKVIVTYSELRAKELYEDYRFFDKKVLLYPSKDLIFYSADIHSNLLVQTRISALKALLEEEEVTIITTMGGCMDHLVPLSDWKKYIFRLDAASSVDAEKMNKQLVEMGYERVGQVEGSGQFAVRGGIIDIYPLTEENPVRIELWGDEVDSIRSFDVESQRSIENLDAITVYPAAEVIVDKQRAEAGILKMEKEVKKLRRQLRDENKTEEAHHLSELLEECREKLEEYGVGAGLDSYVDYFYDRTVSFLDYFTDRDTLVVLDEPNRISQEGDAIEQEFRESMMNRLEKGYVLPGQTGILYSSQEVTGRLNAMRCMGLCTLEPRDTQQLL